jgi:hypothetical protein
LPSFEVSIEDDESMVLFSSASILARGVLSCIGNSTIYPSSKLAYKNMTKAIKERPHKAHSNLKSIKRTLHTFGTPEASITNLGSMTTTLSSKLFFII